MSQKTIKEEDLIIRNYRTSDYDATLQILTELDDTYNIGLKKNQWKASSGLRQFKPNLKRITLIAELKDIGEVVAMGILEATKDTLGRYIGYLHNFSAKKEYIGLNVGKILADRAIQMLKSWGCESIRINLGYGAPDKLIKVFSETGFNPIMIVLEKKFNEKD